MCYVCSKEPSHWGGSFEYPQHMFWIRNKENSFSIHTFIWRPVLDYDESDFYKAILRYTCFPLYMAIFGYHRDLPSFDFGYMSLSASNHDFLACKQQRRKLDKTFMGESFQDYSWIQDFEADSLKKLN